MQRKILLTVLFGGCVFIACSQEKWDLKRSVEYALANNISIKQADVQARLAEVTLKQNRLGMFPALSFSGNLSYNSGRNQDPTNFSLITQSFIRSGYTLQSSVTLFNWFSKRNALEGSAYDAEASHIYTDKVRNDIALNVAAAYLQILLFREQVHVSEVKVQQSQAQLANTRKLVDAGSLPELNAAELEAQLATDSSILITAQANEIQGVLQLKALLNFDAGQPFNVDTPPIEKIPIESLAELQPEAVYRLALQNLPQQHVNELRIRAAQKYVQSNRGALYPSISLFGSLGSNYYDKATQVLQRRVSIDTIGSVTVGGTPYKVVAPVPYAITGKMPYFDQLNQNFTQSAGISISIPILNGGVARGSYERSRLNLKSAELQKELDNQTLKQDIYKAYQDATSALQKFAASLKSVQTAQKAYDFSTSRYNIGLLNSIDLTTNQNRLFSAKIDALSAQYNYIFKLKVLEFYKGMGIRLE